MKIIRPTFTKLTAVLFSVASACFCSAQSSERTTGVSNTGTPYFSDPALSPDASEIAFVSGGDIWTVPAKGGEARLLISHPDFETRPVYSPDGRYIAFTSTRSGNGDIYVLNFANGQLTRLTYDDGADNVNSWSPDGKYIYFSSSSREISGMQDVFRVRVDGGTPMPVSQNRYLSEFFPMPSPDGKTLAITARGVASGQWWRKGHSHLDESEIWLMHEGKNGTYEKITEGGAKELWPMWSKDSKTLYYISDRTGAANLYARPVGGAAKMLTQFAKGLILFPTISYNGQSIVFEKDFKVWRFDLASGKATPVDITRRGVPAGPGVEHVRLTSQFRGLELSPDGKKIAFIAHGDVFVASAKDGGDAVRVTTTGANEGQVTWAPNSNSIVYTSDRDGVSHLYQYNFITSSETRLTNDKLDDGSALFSYDGKTLAFVRDGKELRVLDMNSKNQISLAKGYFDRPPFSSSSSIAWSPDNRYVAYAAYGSKSFQNIYVVPVTGGEAKPVTFLANGNSGSVNWSRDGKYLLFNTSQRTENGAVARVDLVLQRPRFREDQFQQMFTEQVQTTPAPGNPPTTPRPNPEKANRAADTMFKSPAKTVKPGETTNIVFDGIRQRLNLLPLGVDVNDETISKDGNTLLITASVAGQVHLFTYSLDELSREPAVLKQLTSTPGFKSDAQFSPDGKEVYFLEQGRIQSITVDTRAVKPVAVTAELDVDFHKEKVEVFKQAWEVQNKGFYDETFHGADWNAVKTTYEPLAEGANTPDELRRILSLMVGELNASHSGVSGPPSPFITGRLGLRFEANEYENSAKLKIIEVITLGPAAVTGDIHVGDYLVSVDGVPISANVNIDQLLENKINKRVVVGISSAGSAKDTKKVTVRPVNQTTEKGLLYRQWVQQQRDYVAKVSGGRLGYVHMYDMSAQSLNQLYLDIDAENHSREGVVVDVRNNNGGFVNAYALDVLSRKGYMTMTVRGLPSAPARTQLGQRALDAPTILVTNQHSLSDAEDFAEGYRTLNLGKVVGEPTGGWIIYTSAATLIDGTTIRLPFIKVTDHEGKDMELHPRPVDILVSKPLGEYNKDSQLDVAVKVLLQQLDSKLSKK
ncbi:S41 family peptidase [Segetibacter aerophilus]|uniref:Tricorn protease homolog n=1 Tax=Segetibacter aerophilus TaxID=670293 RepID=A0A512BJA6_9BACT|nr:S41 family peptidase [Segetibacter aerophilus]GEO12051.1 peptidase S41 [Segetibacter aerophilus]